MAELTHKRLCELLNYNAESGVFSWKVTLPGRGGCVKAGNIAGSIDTKGRRQIKIDGQIYFAHRLAFLYMTGAWPAQQVDHKDMDHTNNAWRNLRDASASENAINKNIRRRKSRLPRGVHRLPSGRFQACLSVNSRLQYLGAFDTIKEASDAYLAAAKKRSEEFLPKEYLKQPLRPFVDNEQR